jgi:hypothetical protein
MREPHNAAFVAKTGLKTDGLERSRSSLTSSNSPVPIWEPGQMAF